MCAQTTTHQPTRIVILGAGFGGVYTFQRLHKWFHNDSSVELVLVSDNNYFLFTPLLHEVATGNIDPVTVVEPLRKVLGCCLAEFHLAQVCRVNTTGQTVETTNGSVPYDYLVTALGSTNNFYGTEGAQENTFTLKSIRDAIRLKNHVIRAVEAADAKCAGYTSHEYKSATADELLHFVVVGGGPTGVELAAELADLCRLTFRRYYPKRVTDRLQVTLVHRGGELVPQFADTVRKQSLSTLRSKGVSVRLATDVSRITPSAVEMDSGEVLASQTVVWAAGVAPRTVPFDIRVPTHNGKMPVTEYLQVANQPNVFAIGDIAYHTDPETGDETPALAQSATKQGTHVADTIGRMITNKAATPFRYRHQGSLLSLGKWRAAGEVKGYAVYGRFAWWLWRTIYLSKIISFTKKIKVATDWTFNLFQPRDISQLTEFEYENGCDE